MDFFEAGDLFSGEGLFGELFEGIFGDWFGAGADIMADGIFVRAGGMGFAEAASLVGDIGLDYLLWRDFNNDRFGFKTFRQAHEAGTLTEGITALKGHGFFTHQLRTYAEKEGMEALRADYEAHGLRLPPEDLVKQCHRSLAKHLHPDANSAPEKAELMKELNAAKDALSNPAERAAYAKILHAKPDAVKRHFEAMAKGIWKQEAEESIARQRKRIGSLVGTPEQGMSKWFSELTPRGRGMLVFSAVAGIGLLAYGLAKVANDRAPKPTTDKSEPPARQPSRWQARTQQYAAGPTATLG